uniref:Uncharacterized protein n=1 Tax=Anguilla anguilla TaxID=7936 RepID=A0A0E9VAZ0_ANGAN
MFHGSFNKGDYFGGNDVEKVIMSQDIHDPRCIVSRYRFDSLKAF